MKLGLTRLGYNITLCYSLTSVTYLYVLFFFLCANELSPYGPQCPLLSVSLILLRFDESFFLFLIL